MSKQAGTCRSCGAAIAWATTTAGKAMPVDAVPSMEGTIVLAVGQGAHGEDLADVLSGDRLEQARLAQVALRTSHFARCPDAQSWRRR